MNEIIKIENRNGKQAVSARELYNRLGYSDSQFSRWSKKNIIENPYAIEDEDYVGFDIHVEGNVVKDFALSINFSKKLCMLSKTKIGERFRDYFIECEKVAKQSVKPLSQIEALLQSVQMLAEQDKRLNRVEDKVLELDARTTTRPDYFTIAGYARMKKIKCGLTLASSLGRKAAAICQSNGYPMEETPDPRFGKVNTYPLSVLEEVFDMNIY